MVSTENADQLKLLHKKVPRVIAISSFVQIVMAVLLLVVAIVCTIQSNSVCKSRTTNSAIRTRKILQEFLSLFPTRFKTIKKSTPLLSMPLSNSPVNLISLRICERSESILSPFDQRTIERRI